MFNFLCCEKSPSRSLYLTRERSPSHDDLSSLSLSCFRRSVSTAHPLPLFKSDPSFFFFQDALDRANEVMGSSLTQREVKIHVVRDVAPNKPMLCLSFLAPDADGADSGNCADKDAAETPASATDRSGATAPIAAAVDEAGAGAAGTASPSPPSVGSAAAGTTGASSTAAGSAAAAASSSDDATVVAATVASDSREEKGGVEEEEGSGPGAAACNKRQRTAAVPG